MAHTAKRHGDLDLVKITQGEMVDYLTRQDLQAHLDSGQPTVTHRGLKMTQAQVKSALRLLR